MKWIREIHRRLSVFLTRAQRHRDLEEEMQAEANMRDGINSDEARYAAKRRFGPEVRVRLAAGCAV